MGGQEGTLRRDGDNTRLRVTVSMVNLRLTELSELESGLQPFRGGSLHVVKQARMQARTGNHRDGPTYHTGSRVAQQPGQQRGASGQNALS